MNNPAKTFVWMHLHQCQYLLRPNKGLRSDNQLLLNVPVSTLRLKFYGDRAFSVAGPTLWNALPKNIRLCATLAAFKTNLKTYLFKKPYKVWLCTLSIYSTSDLFLLFTWIFYLYHFIVSAVSVTSHNWMSYFNAVSQLYNSYIFHCLFLAGRVPLLTLGCPVYTHPLYL